MSKIELKDKAQKFCEANKLGKKEYTQEAHCAFLARLIFAQLKEAKIELGDEIKIAIIELLGLQGLGGNHSQFKQWLFKTDEEGKPEASLLSKYQLND